MCLFVIWGYVGYEKLKCRLENNECLKFKVFFVIIVFKI